jgi:membrane protein DedA with SNARE-associated domain
MLEEIAKAIPIYFFSMVKFISGPLGGYWANLNIFTTILVTVAGMMTVVLAFSFFGDFLRNKLLRSFFLNRKKFTVRNRKLVTLWKKYGLVGVAALTPILLTPIGGTLLAISFGTPKNKLIFAMFVSASAWSVLLTAIIYFFGNNVLPDFIQ